jgi:hypothetical protein
MVDDSIQELHRQAEINQILTRKLAEQSASRRLAENPIDTYMGFFTPFFYYQQVLQQSVKTVESRRDKTLPIEDYDAS